MFREETWAVLHVDTHRATAAHAVLDLITEIVAEETELLEGRRTR